MYDFTTLRHTVFDQVTIKFDIDQGFKISLSTLIDDFRLIHFNYHVITVSRISFSHCESVIEFGNKAVFVTSRVYNVIKQLMQLWNQKEE